jgi:Putative zinc-finger
VSTHWTDRLSDYQDGELSPADHADCDAHLAECDACRTVLRELRLVTVAARSEEERDPAADLWPGILAKITSGRADQPSTNVRRFTDQPSLMPRRPVGASAEAEALAEVARSSRRISISLPQLALAASLLIAVTASVSYLAAGRHAARPAPQETPIQAMAEALTLPSADVVPANFADAQFDKAVADLERILLDQRETLDPRTVVVIERNLRLIDEAIRQARAALDADPANTYLNSHLAESRRRKLDLLRRATSLSGD